MPSVTLVSVTPQAAGLGFDVQGKYDTGGKEFLGLTVWFRQLSDGSGIIANLQKNDLGGITVETPSHDLDTLNTIEISGVQGGVPANGRWDVFVLTPDTFRLVESVWSSLYTAGTGKWVRLAGSLPEHHSEKIPGQPSAAGFSFSVAVGVSGLYSVKLQLNLKQSPILSTAEKTVTV